MRLAGTAGGHSGSRVRQSLALHETLDKTLLMVALALLGLGIVMVTSASVSTAERVFDSPFYYLQKQLLFVALGLFSGWLVFNLSLRVWEVSSMGLLIISLALLALVLMPGVGKTVNGSTRWISLGLINLQVSELVKLFVVVYLAGYLVRRGEEVRTRVMGFIKPMSLLCLVALLLLLEPDFGAAVVLMLTVMGMMFLGGVRFWQFGLLIALCGASMAGIAISSPYRMLRITAFLDPWADPFNTGFQLTQSLIAIGSGSWNGLGLGSSIQKLFYLPEAHTDFLFAVLAEELGLIGVCLVIGLYAILVWRAFSIAGLASSVNNDFAAFLAYGIGIWIGLQAVINIGVNMGLLPTKGLTLPLMSYGGSSTLVTCAAIGLLLRIHHEGRLSQVQAMRRPAGASP